MATDKVAVTRTKLDTLANVIGSKSGEEIPLTLDEMTDAVESMDILVPQTKIVNPGNFYQIITPDTQNGYTGLTEVRVNGTSEVPNPEFERTVICPLTSFSVSTPGEGGYYQLLNSKRLRDGAHYIITYDSTEYMCTCEELWGTDRFLGNMNIMWNNTSADCIFPFCVEDWNSNTVPIVYPRDTATHTIQIELLDLYGMPSMHNWEILYENDSDDIEDWSDYSGWYYIPIQNFFPTNPPIAYGDVYRITWRGIYYICTATEILNTGGQGYVLGNAKLDGGTTGNNEPFIAQQFFDELLLFSTHEQPGKVSIRVEKLIPTKLAPTMYITQNGEYESNFLRIVYDSGTIPTGTTNYSPLINLSEETDVILQVSMAQTSPYGVVLDETVTWTGAPITLTGTNFTVTIGNNQVTITTTRSDLTYFEIDALNYTGLSGILVDVPQSSGSANLQSKTNINPTTSSQTITPDSGYDGLSSVQINAMPSMTLPTSTSTSASGTSIGSAIGRSTSTRYINIPTGYNSSARYYTISAVANGTVTAPSSASGTSATVSTGTNTLTLSKSVSITPSVTTAGYVSSGTAGNCSVSLTASVTTKAAATITPGTSNQTIASGTYLTGTQTISGDSNLVASNIISGKSIFGVAGNVVIQHYYTGTSTPSSSLGANGDIYLKTT